MEEDALLRLAPGPSAPRPCSSVPALVRRAPLGIAPGQSKPLASAAKGACSEPRPGECRRREAGGAPLSNAPGMESDRECEPVILFRLRKWARLWWKEEFFWKDVTTRTLAILISGSIGLLAASLVGLIKVSEEDAWRLVLLASGVGAIGAFTWILTAFDGHHFSLRKVGWMALICLAITVLIVVSLWRLRLLAGCLEPWSLADGCRRSG